MKEKARVERYGKEENQIRQKRIQKVSTLQRRTNFRSIILEAKLIMMESSVINRISAVELKRSHSCHVRNTSQSQQLVDFAGENCVAADMSHFPTVYLKGCVLYLEVDRFLLRQVVEKTPSLLAISGVTECRGAHCWHTIYAYQLMSIPRFIEKRDHSSVQVKRGTKKLFGMYGFFLSNTFGRESYSE